jgi:segregation and condensation protein A
MNWDNRPMASQFDIHSMVEKPTWKQMLMELIDQNKIDPWDVDIALIADAFMKKVREMKKLDLGVQANIILAAAILLKYKSEYLRYLIAEEQTALTEFPMEEHELRGDTEDIPQLTLVSRIPPKRQITLDELVGEMEKVIKYENADRERIPRGSISETIDFVISEEDIEKKMDEILERIRNNTDESGWSLFSRILENSNSIEIIYTLISILHLVQAGKINIKQDKMFGEIFIFLLDREKEKMKMEVRR